MSVSGPRMTGGLSLIMRILILSGPIDLFEGIDIIFSLTSFGFTRVKLSSTDLFVLSDWCSNSVDILILLCRASFMAFSAVVFPTD